MTADNYTPATALTGYYADRSTNRPARHWATEKLIHDLGALGVLTFFEGPGPNPMALSGADTSKLWLDTDAGVTSSPGTFKRYTGVGSSSDEANWIAVTPGSFLQHIGGLSPVTSAETYATRTAAAAATISSGVTYLETAGFAAVGDGGNALYKKVLASSTGGFQSIDGAYWAPVFFSDEVNVEVFGAVGDATDGGTVGTDDTDAFQDAINYVNELGGGIVRFSKRHLIDSDLLLFEGVALKGPVSMPGLCLPVATGSYDDLQGVLYVNSAATLELRWRNGISNCYILRKGLITPYADQAAATAGIAAFAGTAITITNHDAYLAHLLILGFEYAVVSGGAGALGAPSRLRVEYVCGDCTNGMVFNRVHDIAHVVGCHFWPYLTASRGFTSATNTRSGTAYKWDKSADPTTSDGSYNDRCFAFGYDKGFHLVGALHHKMIGCVVDYPSALSSTAIGFHIDADTRASSLINCEAYAVGTGVYIDSGSNTAAANNTNIVGFYGNNNDTYHVRCVTGRMQLVSSAFYAGATVAAVAVESTSGAVQIVGNEFDALVTPMSINATPYALAGTRIHSNATNATTNAAVSDKMVIRGSTALTSPFEVVNSANSSQVRVGRFRGARATPANNDVMFQTYELSDAAGNATIAYQQNVRLTDVTNGSEDGQVYWSIVSGGALLDLLQFTPTQFGPLTNDLLALGAPSFGWSDFYLASGGRIYHNNGAFDTWGTGTPEGVVTAPVGSTFKRTDGGAGTTLYVKESGSGNTGWVGK